MYILGRAAGVRTSALDTLSFQDIPRIRRILLRWKVLSLLSCLAYVYFTVSLGFIHTRVVRQASIEAAFPIFLSISVANERLLVMVHGVEVRKVMDGVEFVVVDGDDWRCLCVLCQNVRLLRVDGQPDVLAGLRETVHLRLRFLLGVGALWYMA